MNVKRLFRGPWLWIIVMVLVLFAVLQFINSANGAHEVKTATMVKYFDEGKYKDVTFVDGDKRIEATLKDGKEVEATWLCRQGYALVERTAKGVASDLLTTDQ